MEMIKNRLAQRMLEYSGPARQEVLLYLQKMNEIANAPEEMKNALRDDLDKNHRASSLSAEWYCVIVDMVNQRPYFVLIGTLIALLNCAWGIAFLIKKLL